LSSLGSSIGALGKLEFANNSNSFAGDHDYYYTSDAFYTGDDIVGIAELFHSGDTRPYQYSFEQGSMDVIPYRSVIGYSNGAAPGQFSRSGGNDPDNLQGGPSGIAASPVDGSVYVCDPGNSRVQQFGGLNFTTDSVSTGFEAFLQGSWDSPTQIEVGFDGTTYVGDIDSLRVIRDRPGGMLFGAIGGTVSSYATNPPSLMAGARVMLYDYSGVFTGPGGLERWTNASGDYRFEDLPYGDYFVIASRTGYSSDMTTISVIPDETVLANFNLYPDTAAVNGGYSGTVRDRDSNLPIREVQVRLLGSSISTLTQANGAFYLTDILAKDEAYQIELSRADYQTLTKDIYIIAGQVTVDDNLMMEPIT
jgi:hypothetical protein